MNYTPIIIVAVVAVIVIVFVQLRNRKLSGDFSDERELRIEGEGKFKKLKLEIDRVGMDGNRARDVEIGGKTYTVGDVVCDEFVLRGIRPEVGNTWACEFDYLVAGDRVRLFTRLVDDEQEMQWAKEDGKQPEDPYGHDVNARQGLYEED